MFNSQALDAAHRGIALAAVHGTIFTRKERNLRGLAAVGADSVMHFASPASSGTAGLACQTACLAAGGFVLEPFLCVELLLTGGEHELCAAVSTDKSLVFKHVQETPKIDDIGDLFG